ATNVPRVAVSDPVAIAHRARHAPHPVVLKAAADAIRNALVHVDLVELADRDVPPKIPGVPAIPRDGDAAVSGDDQMLAVLRIHPERVILAVHVAEQFSEM